MASSSAASVKGSSSSSSGVTSAAAAAASAAAAPCAGCKFLRRKCQPDCAFAPYFPPDNPRRFAHVHRVFGASNVAKLLLELHPWQREDAANSLAYEADMRMRDPVYGCVGVISLLQHQLRQLQAELAAARAELARCQSAAAAAAGYGLASVAQPGPRLGFGREQQMMVHGYDNDLGARLAVNGVFDVGLIAGMNASGASVGQLGAQGIRPF